MPESSNQNAREYEPLQLSFTIPPDKAFRVEMDERDFRVLVLAGLSAISSGHGGRKPIASNPNVTSTMSVLATLTTPRRVSVSNYGPDPVTLSFGDLNAVAGAGTYMLLAGSNYETPIDVIGRVTAICASGKSAALNLTLF